MAELSAAAQAYKDKLDAYAAQKKDEGYVVSQAAVGGGNMDQAYEDWANANVPVEDLFALGRQFTTNKGKKAKTKKNKEAIIYGSPNATYSLINERGQNQTLLSGSGLDTLDAIYAKARELSTTGGTKANWKVVETLPDGSTRVMADDDPKSKWGKIADIALPILGSLIPIPGVGPLLGAALGAAGGSAVSGIAQGRGIGDILKGAALSGGLGYLGGSALGGLGGGAGGAASGAGAGAAASAAGTALGGLADDIVVQGIKGGLGSAVGGALGGAAGGAAAGALSGAGSGAQPGDIVVQGARNVGQSIPGTIGSVGGTALTGATNQLGGNSSTANNEIVVEGQKPLVPENFTLTPEMLASLGITTEFAATAQGKSTIDKIVDGLRAAGLLTGIVGNAIGGGGGKSGTGTMPGPLGNLNPVFSAKLPTANVPGGVGNPSNFAPRQMPQQDWNRYAMNPEQSFFNYVPQRYTPPVRMAKGGFAVKGRGTGRSDEIDAKLSDGEYVVDAETVALLGDGSSNAGAKALDNLRVAVRKHKGRDLAKGKFSVKAKQPERYLKVRK